MNHYVRKINGILGLALIGATMAGPAFAQQYREAWTFSNQNRASIAALIKSVEDGDSKSSSNAQFANGGGGTTLVCGSDADSTAKGNSSCIILNNATGDIEIGQDSDGDQTANSETNVEETITGADDILDTLNDN